MKPSKRAARNCGATASKRSAQYFKSLIESSLDIITVVSATGIILYESPSVEKILGYRPEERVGKSLLEFLHPDDAPQIADVFAHMIGTAGLLAWKELRVKHRDGTWRTLEGTGRNLLDDPVVAGVIVCSRDITERKRAEQALRQSLERFSKAFLAGPAAMSITRSEDGLFLNVNDQFLKLYGYQREEVLGRTSKELNLWADPDDRERIGQSLRAEQGSLRDLEVMIRTKSGKIRDVLLSIEWIELEDELCALSMAHDITELKKAEEVLRASEEHYRSLFERVPVGIYRTNPEGQIIDANPAFLRIFGYSHSESLMQLKSPDLYVDPEDRQRWQAQLERQGELLDFEVRLRRADGRVIWVRNSAQALRDEGGLVIYYEGLIEDITAWKQAELELRQFANERQSMALRVLEAQEKERKRLARDLHDELGQTLTALKMDSDWIARHMTGNDEIKRLADRLAEKLGEQADLVRDLSYQLRPPILDDLGIGDALESLATAASKRSKARFEVKIAANVDFLPQGVTTAVYRIAQEALTNALRHSGASKARVTFRKLGDSVILRVEDNGKGVSEAQLNDPKSLGIAGMRERTHLLDGELTITPRKGGGTIVTARVPLHYGLRFPDQ